jgi:hypothetical protein
MKTKAIFSIFFTLLMLNVNASNATNVDPETTNKNVEVHLINMVESMAASLEYNNYEFTEVEPWMLDETAFESVEATEWIAIEAWMFEVDPMHEPMTRVEEWMLNARAFEADNEFMNETLLLPEEWMLDVPSFLNNTPSVERIIEVEPWMLSVEAFDIDYIDPLDECPLESWMFEF